MSDLGFIALALALAAAAYSFVGFGLGIKNGDARLVASSQKGAHASTALLTLAVLALVGALLVSDFQVEYVASYTSRDLPLLYTLSALWAGQQGSLLFWTCILSLYATVVTLSGRRRQDPLLPYSSLVLVGTQVFFLGMLLVVANPFRKLDFVPADGLGMNPLLQNPAMIWHPPIVYLGYLGFTVPFAFTLAALISGRLKDPFVPTVRRWTLFAWLCLGLGTLLGAQWAYVELGWGGYWAWDPVENASLLPWLTSTALVHSFMFRGSKLKISHSALAVVTFALCIFGTFVTRSGLITSVHAFAVSTIGLYLLGFLALVVVGSMVLIYRRLPDLRSHGESESLISRPSMLLLAIVLLIAATAAILIGTLFPLVSDTLNVALTSHYFNVSSTTILGPLILLMGVCPFVPWRGCTFLTLARQLLIPLIAALITATSLIILGLRDLLGVLAFSICAVVATATLLQFYARLRSRQTSSDYSAFKSVPGFRRKRRWYGGYVVHLGIVLITIGVVGSSAYKAEELVTLDRGASRTVGAYSLRYDEFSLRPAKGKDIASATIAVFEGGNRVGVMEPQKHFHYSTQQPVSEVAIRTTLKEDLYLALIGWEDPSQSIVLQVTVSPLVAWIWIGGAVLFVGAVTSLWPRRSADAVDRHIEEAIRQLRQGGEEAEEEDSPR